MVSEDKLRFDQRIDQIRAEEMRLRATLEPYVGFGHVSRPGDAEVSGEFHSSKGQELMVDNNPTQEAREEARRQHDRVDEFAQEMNVVATKNADLALRTAILINGGAAVSVLASLGGLAKPILEGKSR
jgi:hypothetical protein